MKKSQTDIEAEIKAYKADRDTMLLKCSVDAYLSFARRHNLRAPSSRASALMTIHKARTAAGSLPLEVRQFSKRWLDEHGYTSLDDGELSTPDKCSGEPVAQAAKGLPDSDQ